ncbi:MAG: crotonase [Deltaproteobacteria bacterium]|nr:crotonase [Deltaproteobacteria bacterium]
MSYRDLTFSLQDGVAVLTLDRPEHRNAFSGAMGDSLGRAYRACDEDDEVRAVVLTGAGDAFCAGADFATGGDTFEAREEKEFSSSPVDPPAFRVRKPVIAAVNGHAVGIGLTLPMQCDIRVFAREGKYGFLHVRRGVLPDAYAHWTVPRAIGFARTAELFLTGRRFGGDEAVQLGLASRALPAAEVLPAALEMARDIATNVAPLSAAVCKRLLWESRSLPADEIEHLETELHRVVMGRPDAVEGVLAFLEKRAPQWQLRVPRDFPKPWPGR